MHTGGQGDLLGFTARHEALIEGSDGRVVTRRHHGGHVERRPHLPAPAPDGPSAPPGAAVAIEGSHPHQGGEALGRALAEPWPSSGRWASRVRATTGPTPGTLRTSWSRSRHSGLARSARS